jgi:hypothetical protein
MDRLCGNDTGAVGRDERLRGYGDVRPEIWGPNGSRRTPNWTVHEHPIPVVRLA